MLALYVHSGAVWSFAFSLDGKRIVSGSHDKSSSYGMRNLQSGWYADRFVWK